MNKKYLWSVLVCTLVAILSLGFIACGGDDDGLSGSNAFVGTWTGVNYEDDHHATITLVFRGDGTGTITEEGDVYDFTYTLTDGQTGILRYTENSGYSGTLTFIHPFSIDGNKMYVYYEDPTEGIIWELTKTSDSEGSSKTEPSEDGWSNSAVVGTWTYIFDGSDFRSWRTLVFKEDGTGQEHFISRKKNNNKVIFESTNNFTYKMTSATTGIYTYKVETSSGSFTHSYPFSVEGNKLIIYEGKDILYELTKSGY